MVNGPVTNSTVTSATQDDIDRVRRIVQLYEELVAESEALIREGRLLRDDMQQALDKEKMRDVLKKIISQNP